jgi:hypothetical protein
MAKDIILLGEVASCGKDLEPKGVEWPRGEARVALVPSV